MPFLFGATLISVAPSTLAMSCPACECDLTLHQPDPELPNRLLATCDECKSWFLANSEGVCVTRLPEFATTLSHCKATWAHKR